MNVRRRLAAGRRSAPSRPDGSAPALLDRDRVHALRNVAIAAMLLALLLAALAPALVMARS